MSTLQKFRRISSLGCTLGLMLAASPALAAGFYIQEQSTKGMGRAYSGEAADQGASSLWWNPASIGGMSGGDATASVTAILPSGDVSNTGTAILYPGQTTPIAVGGDASNHNPINNGVVPSGSIAHALTSQIAVGLTIAAPYNFTTAYPTTSWARYSALTTRLRTIDIQPSVAVQVVPGLSLGGALNVERVSASLGNALPNLSPLLPDGSQNLTGKGWDVGFSLGAQYHQGPISLGLSYKSSIRHHLDGTVTIAGLLGPYLSPQNGSIATTASFATPWMLTLGARYAVTPTLSLNAQVSRTGWAKFDAITIGAPINAALPENYRNTWTYSLGADADISPTWTLRAGVERDLTPVQDAQRDARVPDTDRWTLAMGASHAFSKAFSMDAAANYLIMANGPIDRNTAAYVGTPLQTAILTSGEVSNAHVFILSLGGRLRF